MELPAVTVTVAPHTSLVAARDLVVPDPDALAERLAAYARQADGALSPNTERAIRADTALFA